MAQPTEIFSPVKGMVRDFGIDSIPAGYFWDIMDALPNRKGGRIEQRGGWQYFPQTPSFVTYPGQILGGAHVRFMHGTKLIVDAAGPPAGGTLWDVNLTTGAATSIGQGHSSMIQNGVMLKDKVYFFHGASTDATGPEASGFVPRVVTWDGVATPVVSVVTTAPKARVGIVYKERLVVGGDPGDPARVYFSPTPLDGGPEAVWDAVSNIGTSQAVTGLASLANQILVFHPAMIERLRGTKPSSGVAPTAVEGDFVLDTLTDQVGCTMPHTIVPWRENIIFADEHGVFLTDGATVRNLIELGGMGDFWRIAYGSRNPGASVCCGIFLDYLLVTVNGPALSFTLVCDLNERTWIRFTNFRANCYIPSTSETEESYVGHRSVNRLMKTSPMFQDPLPIPDPAPDYIDGDGQDVLMQITTGFKRLTKEEGMQRIRNLYVSYENHSEVRGRQENAVKIEYRLSPPRAEDLTVGGDVGGWFDAGSLPDVSEYSRKKIPVGKRGYGIMVRMRTLRSTRTTRFFSVGAEHTSQDRAKVTA